MTRKKLLLLLLQHTQLMRHCDTGLGTFQWTHH